MTLNRQRLIWGLEELADKEAQRRVWTGRSTTEMYSLEEALSAVFDMSRFSELDQKRTLGNYLDDISISENKSIGSIAAGISAVLVEDDLIDSPQMSEIRKISAKLIARLAGMKE